ncbi:MAG: P1 family peptidase [Balneolaceae bacterium]|nr:P1 family peptidase [Balneolaceae bacterium]
MKHKALLFIFLFYLSAPVVQAQETNIRERGVKIGVLDAGPLNSITDVEGVRVGHYTLIEGNEVRTGVTALLPHGENLFQQKVPAAIYIGNGFGKLAGYSQVEELGNIETPIILTNTLSVPTASNALIDYILKLKGNENVRSVNPVVGETNDGYLNDIRGRHITRAHVLEAIKTANTNKVKQGNVGAGTGTTAFGFKGGIGSSSRKLPESIGGYSVGVLVQTNFGGVLEIAGVPIGKELNKYYLNDTLNDTPDGSCMIVLATDAPLQARNLKRLAKRTMMGLAKTGGIASNSSGDYVIAFSTSQIVRYPYQSIKSTQSVELLRNEHMSPLFMAAIEATEEAIINSLFAAETMEGRNGHVIESIPKQKVLQLLERYGRINK